MNTASPAVDDDFYVHQSSPMKVVIQLMSILLLTMSSILFIGLSAYLIACYYDNKMPIEVSSFTATDTYLDGKFEARMVGKRTRQCEVKTYQQAVDVKNNIIFEKLVERPFNGVAGKDIDATYPDLDLNDRARNPGPAKMYMNFQWVCQYNAIQRLLRPLELTISTDLYLYATKEEYEEAVKKKEAHDSNGSGSGHSK